MKSAIEKLIKETKTVDPVYDLKFEHLVMKPNGKYEYYSKKDGYHIEFDTIENLRIHMKNNNPTDAIKYSTNNFRMVYYNNSYKIVGKFTKRVHEEGSASSIQEAVMILMLYNYKEDIIIEDEDEDEY